MYNDQKAKPEDFFTTRMEPVGGMFIMPDSSQDKAVKTIKKTVNQSNSSSYFKTEMTPL